MSNAFSRRAVGVDAGASLWKLALWGDGLETRRFPAGDVEAARRCIAEWQPVRIGATGAGAPALGERVDGLDVVRIPEFRAWARGGGLLAARARLALPERYLLVSLGTGTSALLVHPAGAERVGGSALGGGALLGLGRLLLDVDSFEELVDLAMRGDRRKVDLLVGDIYREADLPLPPHINAASFGKLASRAPADLAHALVGLVGENVGLICAALTHLHGAQAVVYGGSTLTRNPPLQEVLQGVTGLAGCPVHVLDDGAFCGAVGAAALSGAA